MFLSVLKEIERNYKFVVLLLITFSLLQLLYQFIGRSSLFFLAVTFLSHTIIFVIATSEKHLRFCWVVYLIQVLLTVPMLLNHFLINYLSTLNVVGMGCTTIIVTLNIILLILESYFCLASDAREFFKVLFTVNLTEKIMKGQLEEIVPGSLIIGTDIETGKVHYIPPKDRFLHMLILGSTGTGKTSQVIIPAIKQDIYESPETGIIVLEPKQDLAEFVWAMAKHNSRDVIYFNPVLPDCPYFNPLYGEESDVLENMATTFRMLNPDSPIYFQNMNEDLLKKAIKVIKRMYGNDATLLDLQTLVFNTNGAGGKLIATFQSYCDMEKRNNPDINPDLITENQELIGWFIFDYFTGSSGERGGTKTFEHCSGIRAQVSKLCSNKFLRKVLNPPKGTVNGLDFDLALAEGQIVTIATAQGALRDLGTYLGYFIIFQLQSAVFRRKGNENTRRHCHLYIDECQKYLNPGFADMLTQGRSYRVATTLATQNKALLGFNAGRDARAFIDLITTNCRNVIIYPGSNIDDAKYYSEQFGEILTKEKQRGVTVTKKGLFNFIPSGTAEQTRYTEKMIARFSPSDIIFRPFGEITAMYIKDNTIQLPVVLRISYIDEELKQCLDLMVEQYNTEQEEKAAHAYGMSIHGDLKANLSLKASGTVTDESRCMKDWPIQSLEAELTEGQEEPSFTNKLLEKRTDNADFLKGLEDDEDDF